MQKRVLFLCLLVLFASPVTPLSATDFAFKAVGSSLAFPLYDQWFFSYGTVNPRVHFDYEPSGSGAGIRALTSNAADFAASDSPISQAQRAALSPADDVAQYPIAATTIVLVYNLPYGNLMDIRSSSSQLVLDGPTTAAIFSKQITNWRDPRILALQSSAVAALLPNASIVLVVRSDSSGTTTVFQSSLKAFDPASLGQPASTWSAAYRNDPHVLTAVENLGVAAAASWTQNSIGYVAFSTIAKSTLYRYAAMMDGFGAVMNTPSLRSAFQDPYTIRSFNHSNDFASDALFNSQVHNAWPMGAVTYILIRRANYSAASCEKRRELVLFWHWALSNEFEQARLVTQGFDSLGPELVEVVVDVIKMELQCFEENRPLLALLPVAQHGPEASYDALVATNFTALVLFVVLVAYYFKKDFTRVATSAKVFLFSLALGGILNFISVAFFFLIPSEDYVCRGRLWFSALGFSLVFSALFCRGYQIYSVANLAKNIRHNVRHMLIVAVGNALVMLAQIVLLVVWQTVDPFSAQITNIDDTRQTFEWICRSEHPLVWWGLEIAYAVFLIGFCLAVAYLTWDLKHMVRESKWMSISIYNSMVVLLLSITLYQGGIDHDDTVFWVTGCAIFLLNSSIMFAMFVPKLRDRIKNDEESIESSTAASHSQSAATGHHDNSTLGDKLPSKPVGEHDKNRMGSPRTSKFGSRVHTKERDSPKSRSPANRSSAANSTVSQCEMDHANGAFDFNATCESVARPPISQAIRDEPCASATQAECRPMPAPAAVEMGPASIEEDRV